MHTPDHSIIAGITLVLTLAVLGCLYGCFRCARRKRLMDDTPTLTTLGVFIGLVELSGTAETDNPLIGYLSEAPCVWFKWSVDEHWERIVVTTSTDSQGKTIVTSRTESGWSTVASGGEQIPFYLRDEDGEILVRPEGATIEALQTFYETCSPISEIYYGKGPQGSVSDSTNRRRFVEQAIPLHTQIYLIGQAREREDVVAAEISHQPDDPLYLISTRSEQQVSKGYGAWAWGFAVLGLVAVLGAWFTARGAEDQADAWPVYVPVILFYFALVGGLWFGMVFNSLVMLRQRVRQGWSLIDVQLKRRADLIPALVATVKGYADYEKRMQEAVALLRSQAAPTPLGSEGENPEAVGRVVMALAEDYPELKANESFLGLQHQLAETEQRIALARGYFNEIVKFYNTRLEVQPDGLVAWLFGFKKAEFLEASGFERVVPKVQLHEIDPWSSDVDDQGLDL